MGHFLRVAYKVLDKVEEPLSAKQITDLGGSFGWLKTKGKTPYQTMKSKLSTDILKHNEKSRFMRIARGIFGLREWEGQYEEYIADRFQKALLNEVIPVFTKELLKKYKIKPGLHTGSITFLNEIINDCFPMLRREAEMNYDVIQLISVFILKFESRILTYKRTARLPETRLHHEFSLFFGGHISQRDVVYNYQLFSDSIPIAPLYLLQRELNEEIIIDLLNFQENSTFRGILYDPSRDVSSQHIGIVFGVNLPSSKFKIQERGFLMHPKFETLDEIEKHIEDFENWSVLLFNYEKDRLSGK